MKKFLHSRYGASKGAALIIVLAFVVLATGLSLAYLTRTTTNRQLAQSSYHDTSADLLARTALDITVGDLKQEIITTPVTKTISNRYGTAFTDHRSYTYSESDPAEFLGRPSRPHIQRQLRPCRGQRAHHQSCSLEQPLLDP